MISKYFDQVRLLKVHSKNSNAVSSGGNTLK